MQALAPAPDMPGFYYDEAKRKYFRKLPAHLAPPGFKETQQTPKENFRTEKPTKGIFRSTVLNHPLGGRYSLNRELGSQHTGNFPDSKAETWAKGLDRRGYYCNGISNFVYDSLLDVHHYVTDEDSILLYAPFPEERCIHVPTVANLHALVDIFSLEISPNRWISVLSAGGNHRKGNNYLPPRIEMLKLTNESGWPDQVFESSTHWEFPNTTLWAASPNRFINTSHFAIGTDHGIARVFQGQAAWQVRSNSSTLAPSHVLAVDWLNEKTVICGHRNGAVGLVDTRLGPHACSIPIVTPYCVGKVRALDQNRIVVAGNKNNMNLYDLRYAKSSEQPHTTPFVNFPDYRNKATPGYLSGFDVSFELNLIATTCDFSAFHESVTFFDASSGKKIAKSESRKRHEKFTYQNEPTSMMASCVRINEGRKNHPTVMVASYLGLEKWA